MKKNTLREAALSRITAAPFVVLGGHELIKLRQLSDLAFRTFVEICHAAGFKSGKLEISYARLCSLVDSDRAPTDCRTPRPTLKRIRTALDALVELGLVKLDRISNEIKQGLFLTISPRAGITAADRKQGRVQGTTAKEKNVSKSRFYKGGTAKPGQGRGQGAQQAFSTPTEVEKAMSKTEKTDPPRGVEQGSAHADPRPPEQPQQKDERPAAATPPPAWVKATRSAKPRKPEGMPMQQWEMVLAMRPGDRAKALAAHEERMRQAKAAGNTGLEEGGAPKAARSSTTGPTTQAAGTATQRETEPG